MAVITTDRFTERLTRKLEREQIPYRVVKSSGDACGRYLLLNEKGRAIAGLGWTQREAAAILSERMAEYVIQSM